MKIKRIKNFIFVVKASSIIYENSVALCAVSEAFQSIGDDSVIYAKTYQEFWGVFAPDWKIRK